MSNFINPTQPWKERLKHWTYMCPFVALHYFFILHLGTIIDLHSNYRATKMESECLEKSHCAHTLAHHRGNCVEVHKLQYIEQDKYFWLWVILFLEHQILKVPSIALWEWRDSRDKSSVRVSPNSCFSLLKPAIVGHPVLLPQLWWDGCCSLPA